MAQKQRTQRPQQSDFPIFEYLDAVMPTRLLERFLDLPRHVRWTIISAVASLFLLWLFLRIVVGGLNHYIATRGAFLYDALYLPYELEARPLPELPETMPEDGTFVVLPDVIAERYMLQIPPTEEELEAATEAKRQAFLAVSLPVQMTLEEHRTSFNEYLEAQAAEVPAAAAGVDETAAEGAEAEPTAAPTVNPVVLQLTAVDGLLNQLVVLNETLADEGPLSLIDEKIEPLQQGMAAVSAAGVTVATADPFLQHLDFLAAQEPPTVYAINDCITATEMGHSLTDKAAPPPCILTQPIEFVERADYLRSGNGAAFNIAAVQYDSDDAATDSVGELFHHARAIGGTGNFAIANTIAYDYFISRANDVFTLVWSHDNWVYSVSTSSMDEIDAIMPLFPY